MNKEVIAFLNKDGVEFYDRDGKRTDCSDLDKCYIYALLPDEYFFFFQSEIVSKRRAYLTIEAYAKSTFPINNGFVGYVPDFLPLIGYFFFSDKIPEEFAHIIEKADVITTPFAVYLHINSKKSFIYEGKSVCAIYDNSGLKHYTLGDECLIEERIENSKKFEKIKYSKQKTINNINSLAASKSVHKTHLPVSKGSKTGFESWKISRFVLLAAALLVFIAGGILRYSSYSSELKLINKKIDVLYKKALGNKHYSDPYGVLLYKAESSSASSGGISPLKLIYALSKSKDGGQVKIDYLSFDRNGIKIRGKIDNYASLVKYAQNLNNLLAKKFTIQSSSSKNGKLLFTLTYSAVE